MLEANIKKRLGSFCLDVHFCVEDVDVFALLGPSGAGKSLTLKCIAGIERPDRGRIVLNGRTLFDSEKHINLSTQTRRVGYLFQQYALFPNMTAEENIAAGVREKKRIPEIVPAMLEHFRLKGLEKQYPYQLSGGQQQRTALARICANEPDILLLDEPFSALDSPLRYAMEEELRELIRELKKPVILVSHDQREVFRLSKRIAVLNGGYLENCAEKHKLFKEPKTLASAVMTGCENLSPVTILTSQQIMAESWGTVLSVPPITFHTTALTHIGIRSESIRLSNRSETINRIRCQIADYIENPFSYTLLLIPEKSKNAQPIAWEVAPEIWDKIKTENVIDVTFPEDSILLLTEPKRVECYEKSKC